MKQLLADSARKLFSDLATPHALAAIESGTDDASAAWQQIEQAGFADALLDEAAGGAGLTLHDVFDVLVAAGRHALPLPLGATMWVRRLLADHDLPAPTGALTIAATPLPEDGPFELRAVPFGRVASAVLVNRGDACWLLPTDSAECSSTGVHRSLQAHLRWSQWPAQAQPVGAARPCLEAGALIGSALLAGALDSALQMSLAYAADRVQFGRPIGRFQAIQQQLAEAAELTQAALMAAEMGAAAGLPCHGSLLVALAKARTSAAVARCAATAHAVHGAMGITAEYPLQLATRRLHEWRGDYGSETLWQRRIGAALLAPGQGRSLEFMLHHLDPSHATTHDQEPG